MLPLPLGACFLGRIAAGFIVASVAVWLSACGGGAAPAPTAVPPPASTAVPPPISTQAAVKDSSVPIAAPAAKAAPAEKEGGMVKLTYAIEGGPGETYERPIKAGMITPQGIPLPTRIGCWKLRDSWLFRFDDGIEGPAGKVEDRVKVEFVLGRAAGVADPVYKGPSTYQYKSPSAGPNPFSFYRFAPKGGERVLFSPIEAAMAPDGKAEITISADEKSGSFLIGPLTEGNVKQTVKGTFNCDRLLEES